MTILESLSTLSRRIQSALVGDPTGEPMSDDERHNSLIVRYEVPLTNFAFGLMGFFALFAIRLDASNQMVGWLTSGPALVNLLWLIPCGRLVQRSSSYKIPLIVGMIGQRVLLASVAVVPFLPATWRVPALVILASLVTIPQFTWILAFQSGVSEIFTPRRMTTFLGQRWSLGSLSNMAFNYLVGSLLDIIPFPLNFQSIFFTSGTISQSSLLLMSRLRLPPRSGTAARAATPSGRSGLLSVFQQRPAFLRFETAVLISYLAVYAAQPLFVIYWVRELGASGAWVGALNAVYLLGSTAGTFLWGRWCNRGNDRRNLVIAAVGMMAGYPLLTALFGRLGPLLLVGALSGFFAGGNELQMFNRVVRLSTREERPNYIAVHNFVLSIAGVAAPLISTALVSHLGTRPVLALAGAFGLIGASLVYGLGWGKSGEQN
jgi:MFS family permease